MFVSLIIPTYNQGFCVEACLQAVFCQTFPEASDDKLEVIVVDDGSTDNTPQILGLLSSQYPQLIVIQQKNKGPSAARNVGVEKARGDILAFLDSDCIPDPNWLQMLVEPLRKGQQWVGVEGQTLPASEDYTPLNHFIENRQGGQYWTCNIAYRTAQVREIGGFDETFLQPGGEDIDMAYRMLVFGKILFQPMAIVKHLILKRPLIKQLQGARSFSSLIRLWKKHPGVLVSEGSFTALVWFHLCHIVFPIYHTRSWLWRNPSVYFTFCFIRLGMFFDTLIRLPRYYREARQ